VPKWGLYRSLSNVEGLRDEIVRYNDICIAEGRNTCPDNLPEPWNDDQYLNINPFPGVISFDGNGLTLILQRLFLSSYQASESGVSTRQAPTKPNSDSTTKTSSLR